MIEVLDVNSGHVSERWRAGTAWWLKYGHPQRCFYCKEPTWLFEKLWYIGGMTDMIVHEKCYWEDCENRREDKLKKKNGLG